MGVAEDSRIEWAVLGQECLGMAAKICAPATNISGYGYSYYWWYYAVPIADCHTPEKEM